MDTSGVKELKMEKEIRFIFAFYFFVAGVEIVAEYVSFRPVIFLTKPLCMVILIYLWLVPFCRRLGGRGGEVQLLAALALLFSLVGDIFLMVDRDGFFLYGLGSFLFTHLHYIRIFWKIQKGGFYSFRGVVAGGGGFGLAMVLFAPYAGRMVWAIGLYAAVISAMFACSFSCPSAWVRVGAGLFVLSDFIIAYDKFLHPVVGDRVWIMSTYLLAQCFIHWGIFRSLLRGTRGRGS